MASTFPMVTAIIGGGPGTVAVSLVPLFAIGMVYYRYLMADPESRPIDVRNVSMVKLNRNNQTSRS